MLFEDFLCYIFGFWISSPTLNLANIRVFLICQQPWYGYNEVTCLVMTLYFILLFIILHYIYFYYIRYQIYVYKYITLFIFNIILIKRYEYRLSVNFETTNLWTNKTSKHGDIWKKGEIKIQKLFCEKII